MGRHIVEQFLLSPNSQDSQDSQNLVLFNRGKTNPDLFQNEDLQIIHGDRETQPELLADINPDVVIDCCGHYPSSLDRLSEILKTNNPYYIYISSCSVYDHEKDSINTDESAEVLETNIEEEKKNDPSMEYYGVRKLLCEQVIQKHFPKHCILRPGLIVGSYDSTFRFPYWIKRLSEGGEVLAPDGPETPTQFIDAKDIATWITQLILKQPIGIFNTVGDVLSFEEFLEQTKQTLHSNCSITYLPEEFLKDNDVSCWMEVPLWVYRDMNIFLKRSNNRAKDFGLKFRDLKETIEDVNNWINLSQNLPDDSYNLTREKEKLVLKKYHSIQE